MKLLNSIFSLLTLATYVNAHGQLTVPEPRPDLRGDIRSASQREPSFTLNGIRPTTGGGGSIGYFSTDFRCRGYDRDNSQQRAILRAGEDFTIGWELEARHPGDCFLYVSVPGQDIDSPANWFKILSIPGCGATDGVTPPQINSLTFKVPEGIPACDECVLRWEWYAVHLVDNVEFYSTCSDVSIVNNLGIGSVDSDSIVTISDGTNHLPQSADQYRKAYNGQRFIVGPPEAKFNLIPFNDVQSTTSTIVPSSTSETTETTSSTVESTSTYNQQQTSTQTITVTTTAIPTYQEKETVTVTTTVNISPQQTQTVTITSCASSTYEPTITPSSTYEPTITSSTESVQETTNIDDQIQPIPDYVCSFEDSGYEINSWSSGFVINHALFSNFSGTTVEFDWDGSSNAQVTNYWNAELEVFNNGGTVRFTTTYNNSPFGFSADGQFSIKNLKVNGYSC